MFKTETLKRLVMHLENELGATMPTKMDLSYDESWIKVPTQNTDDVLRSILRFCYNAGSSELLVNQVAANQLIESLKLKQLTNYVLIEL